MSTTRTIIKNIFSLSAVQVLTKLLTLVLTAYTARVLGVEQFGRWSFAVTMASYFGVLATLGLDAIAARHLARNREQLGVLMSNILPLKFMGSLVGLCVVGVVAATLHKPAEVKWLVFLSYLPLAMGFWSLVWVFIGLERLELMALVQLVEQFVNVTLVLMLVHSPEQVLRVPLASVASVFASGLFALAVYLRKAGAMHWKTERGIAMALLKESLPFGLSQVLGQMYYNFDTVMLSFMRTDVEVGWYNAAYRLLSVIISFRYTVIYSLNPTFARLFVDSQDEMRRLAAYVLRLALYVSLPLGVGGTVLAGSIIQLVFGAAYSPGASALRVLVWSPALLLLNLVGPVILTAAGRWKTMLRIAATIVAVNVGLNFILIPRWGITGAAWATVAADATSFGLHWVLTRKIAALTLWRLLAKPTLSALCMGVILWPLRGVPVFLSIPLGAAVYVAGLAALRAVKWSELQAAFASVLRR